MNKKNIGWSKYIIASIILLLSLTSCGKPDIKNISDISSFMGVYEGTLTVLMNGKQQSHTPIEFTIKDNGNNTASLVLPDFPGMNGLMVSKIVIPNLTFSKKGENIALHSEKATIKGFMKTEFSSTVASQGEIKDQNLDLKVQWVILEAHSFILEIKGKKNSPNK